MAFWSRARTHDPIRLSGILALRFLALAILFGIALTVVSLLVVARRGPSLPPSDSVVPPSPTPARETITKSATVSVVILPAQEKGRLQSVVIEPRQANVRLGENFTFVATAYDAEGKPAQDVSLTWRVNQPEAGHIAPWGNFTASGTTGNFENGITVIAEQPWQGLTITKAVNASLAILPPLGRAQLDHLRVYPQQIQAVSGQIIRLYAIGYDVFENPIPGLQFDWTISDLRAGKTNPLGYFTAGDTPGSYENAVFVTATQKTDKDTVVKSAFATVVIREPAPLLASRLVGLDVVPGFVSLTPGERMQLYAVGYDSLGGPVQNMEVEWLSDAVAGSIDKQGVFTAGQRAGTYESAISVKAAQKLGEATIVQEAYATVVINHPEDGYLTSLGAFPSRVVIPPGGEATLAAIGTDARGYMLPDLKLTWEIARPEAGRVTPEGDFTASNIPGIYPRAIKVAATQQTAAGPRTLGAYVDVTIVGRLSSLKPQPAMVVIPQGQSIQLQVMGYDENDIAIPWLDIRWRMLDPGAGNITPLGIFQASGRPAEYPDAIIVEVTQVAP